MEGGRVGTGPWGRDDCRAADCPAHRVQGCPWATGGTVLQEAPYVGKGELPSHGMPTRFQHRLSEKWPTGMLRSVVLREGSQDQHHRRHLEIC